MSASKVPPLPHFELTEEQLNKISGADVCSPDDIGQIFENLTSYYESLIGFTSYLFERVITSSK